MRFIVALLVAIAVMAYDNVQAFCAPKILGRNILVRKAALQAVSGPASDFSAEETAKAMADARNCAAKGLSPGAGLATAEEQGRKLFDFLCMTFVPVSPILSLFRSYLPLLRDGQ